MSTPETTALDLVTFVYASGGLSNVATVLTELAARMEPGALCDEAQRRPAPVVQRLGHLLDLVERPRLAEPLLRSLMGRRFRPVLLDPSQPRGTIEASAPWRVIANVPVEVDL